MRLSSEKNNGSSLTWQNGELEVTGKIKQISGDGGTYDVGVYKGVYSEKETYYKGDDVTFTSAFEACTYRCLIDGTTNVPPTNSDVWQLIARGKQGDSGLPGKDGTNGKPGAPIVFRGEWKRSNEYYGNPNRLDVVKYNGEYYVTTTTSGIITGSSTDTDAAVPGIDSRWGYFGAQFESVATDFLYAQDAHIGGWTIMENKLGSKNNTIFLDGNTNNILVSDIICLDSKGLTLYGDKTHKANDIKAQISVENIETALDLGVETKDKYPTFNISSVPDGIIYGVGSGRHTNYYGNTGNIKMSESIVLNPLTKAYFKNMSISMVLHFREISDDAKTEVFATRKLSLKPIINGEVKQDIYYEYPIELPNASQADIPITIKCPELVSSKQGAVITLGFDVSLTDLPRGGSLKFSSSLSVKVEKLVLETESEQKTLVAPNGFYCYGGNGNLVWVTPDRVQIKGGQGPVISSGQYALKISPKGFFISKDFTNTSEDKNWEPIFSDGDQIISSGNRAFKVASDGFYVCSNFTSSNPLWLKASL